MAHIPVLLKEVTNLLNIKPNGIYLDLTLGGGGHSREILKKLKQGRLIAVDIDNSAIEKFEKTENVLALNKNFSEIDEICEEAGITEFDGILADLGWSSDQLEGIAGLSYRNLNDDLDMRMDTSFGVKASDLLNALNIKELEKLFERYADIRGQENKKLVKAIINCRGTILFEKVADLIKVIDESFETGKISRFGKSDSVDQIKARVFQSLRIAVNAEFTNLKRMLEKSLQHLKSKGRLAVITFHSGEERIVTEFIKLKKGFLEVKSNQYGEVYTRASVEELTENLKARSAKLFVLEKI